MDRKFLYTLLDTVSVSGNEEANQEHALEFGKAFAHTQLTDPVGNVISVFQPDKPCKVLLSGHMDEIGFRVTHISDDGLCMCSARAGCDRTCMWEARCRLSTRKSVTDSVFAIR
ncbi:MAG: hypothetical protein IJ865_08515 [Clostridia bacterium]|nr:hypothetical protein [Clostridia bacterium]